MDELTNDLDATTRAVAKDALAAFDGIGILISRDRDLLDGLAHEGRRRHCPAARSLSAEASSADSDDDDLGVAGIPSSRRCSPP